MTLPNVTHIIGNRLYYARRDARTATLLQTIIPSDGGHHLQPSRQDDAYTPVGLQLL